MRFPQIANVRIIYVISTKKEREIKILIINKGV